MRLVWPSRPSLPCCWLLRSELSWEGASRPPAPPPRLARGPWSRGAPPSAVASTGSQDVAAQASSVLCGSQGCQLLASAVGGSGLPGSPRPHTLTFQIIPAAQQTRLSSPERPSGPEWWSPVGTCLRTGAVFPTARRPRTDLLLSWPDSSPLRLGLCHPDGSLRVPL